MHASVLGICLREDQPWGRSSVVEHFFPDAKPHFPHLLFQCSFSMFFAVAAAVIRCTPDNCTLDLAVRFVVWWVHQFTSPDVSRWWHRPMSGCSRPMCIVATWVRCLETWRWDGGPCREYFVLVSKTGRFWEDFQTPLIHNIHISGPLWQGPIIRYYSLHCSLRVFGFRVVRCGHELEQLTSAATQFSGDIWLPSWFPFLG